MKMLWRLSNRAEPLGCDLADRHYSRQHIGSSQYVPPGRCLCLIAVDNQSVWVTSWPFAKYTHHQWAGAWNNCLFRREGGALASDLIRQAVSVTRWKWPNSPDLGMVTFVNADKIKHKRDPGRCYKKAGFTLVGKTKGGLLAFQMLPNDMPPPLTPFPKPDIPKKLAAMKDEA